MNRLIKLLTGYKEFEIRSVDKTRFSNVVLITGRYNGTEAYCMVTQEESKETEFVNAMLSRDLKRQRKMMKG